MTPMRSQVELWRPSDLTVTASNLDGFRRSIVDVVETMRNDVDGMAPDWSGIAFDAAARRADDEYDEVRRLGRTIQAIVDAYNEGARELESVLGGFLRRVVVETEELFVVTEEWALTRKPAEEGGLRDRQDELADYFAERIRNAVAGVRMFDEKLAAALEAFGVELSLNSPQGVPSDLRDAIASTPGRLTAASVAFEAMFGRRPAGAVDWRTAVALDPTSYLDKNQASGPRWSSVVSSRSRGGRESSGWASTFRRVRSSTSLTTISVTTVARIRRSIRNGRGFRCMWTTRTVW